MRLIQNKHVMSPKKGANSTSRKRVFMVLRRGAVEIVMKSCLLLFMDTSHNASDPIELKCANLCSQLFDGAALNWPSRASASFFCSFSSRAVDYTLGAAAGTTTADDGASTAAATASLLQRCNLHLSRLH